MQDILIIGAGINGAGIARDAAGRGLKVSLCEQHDIAGHTSSASSKLIHGGLRYLENYQFGLVRKSLQEREVLMRIAPHLIHPLRFNMPHEPTMRPSWMLKLGLFIYDHLAKRELIPASEVINLRHSAIGTALQDQFQRAYAYSDARVHDARLAVLNVVDAFEHGATIYPRTRCISLTRQATFWEAVLSSDSGETTHIKSKTVVNAAGPWANSVASDMAHSPSAYQLRLVKGSHIIVKRWFKHDEAYIFQNHDKRIVFALPFEDQFTLIGTTDFDYTGDVSKVSIDKEEVEYLCNLANHYFKRQLKPSDVIHDFSGVRALPVPEQNHQKASTLPRDYVLELNQELAPIVHVLGGKITTYRKLSEDVLSLLCPLLGTPDVTWTDTACLPGGNLFGDKPCNASVKHLPDYIKSAHARFPELPTELVTRWVLTYGSRIDKLMPLESATSDLGEHFGHGLYEPEVRYLIEHEFAGCADDIIWRRTWLGIHFSDLEIERLNQFIANQMK